MGYVVVIIKGQATNNSSWRSYKVFSSESLTAFYFPLIDEEGGDAAFDGLGEEADELREIFGKGCAGQLLAYPDLTYTPWNCSGAMSKSIWEHQLEKIGIQTWRALAEGASQGAAALSAGADDIGVEFTDVTRRWLRLQEIGHCFIHLDVFSFGTDKGPDQVGTRKRVLDEVADLVYVWVFWVFCIMHQIHLIVKRQLSRDPSYFSRMAVMTNTWRSPHVASKIYRCWARLFSRLRADKVARGLPPKMLTGRFGSAHKCEKFFMRASQIETAETFKLAFDIDPANAPTVPASIFSTDPEDAETYQQRQGRWKKLSVQSASDRNHWAYMGAVHVSRGPTMHCHFWLEKENGLSKQRISRGLFGLDEESESTVQKLVYRKAGQFMFEFSELLLDSVYGDPDRWGLVWQHVDGTTGADREPWHAECVSLLLEGACDFSMRLVENVQYDPGLQLVWLAYNLPDTKCSNRLRVAKD